MWLITNFGFFSVVQKPDDEGAHTLTVRARVKADLEALRDRYLPELGPITANAGTDYKYRAKVSRNALAAAHVRIVQDIDYNNFKNSVAKQQGYDRSNQYHKIWDVLYELQDKESEPAPSTLTDTPVEPGTSYGGVLFDDHGRVLLREPTTTTESTTAVFQSFLPVRIVQLSFLRVAQHLVRLGDFFKLLLRRALVVGVFILRSPVRARQLARSASRNHHHPPPRPIARRRAPSPRTTRFHSRRARARSHRAIDSFARSSVARRAHRVPLHR